ncbi:MAG TPA: hypothetical protein PKI01_08695 [Bacteroidales bacterium]|nr:hypothetical protein [Bacteroidales bacterium]
MKRLTLLFFVLSAVFVEAQTIGKKNQQAIISLLASQEKCWNDGNIEGYMSGYWNSDSLKFITKTGITYGWKPTLEMYKEHYPDKVAMGTLDFDDIRMIKMNGKTIFVMGKWTLQKTTGQVGGRFTLVCKKMKGEWKIVIDHSS